MNRTLCLDPAGLPSRRGAIVHDDVMEGRLVFQEALNLYRLGWFGTFNYTISNVFDSNDGKYY